MASSTLVSKKTRPKKDYVPAARAVLPLAPADAEREQTSKTRRAKFSRKETKALRTLARANRTLYEKSQFFDRNEAAHRAKLDQIKATPFKGGRAIGYLKATGQWDELMAVINHRP